MHKIQLPNALAEELGRGGYPAALCDEAGEVRAVVVPPDWFREMFELWADHAFGPSPGERLPVEPDSLTTQEAVEFLRALEARLRGAA